MIFNTLGEYIKDQLYCPFCQSQLKISFHRGIGNNFDASSFLLCSDRVEFLYTCSTEFVTNINTFKISLYFNNKLNYSIIQPLYWDKKHEKKYLISSLNNAGFQIMCSCDNLECTFDYFKSSLITEFTETEMKPLTLYNESFRYNNILCQNNYIDNEFNIYITNEEPFTTKLVKLVPESIPDILNKIKLISVFS